MKELDFIKIINETLSDNSFLGDDCAYLEEFGLFVTHDTLVEDVHFSFDYATPYQVGYKAVMVNLSDLASSFVQPKYITVSLSMPKNTTDEFVKEIYKGINDACNKYNVKVIGGDITGAEKCVISICAIGKKSCNYQAKRHFAQVGDLIVVTGQHGSSGAGLKCFEQNIDNEFLKNKHLLTEPKFEQATVIANFITRNIACMDSSDGLYDAIFKICEASNVSAQIDFDKIPYNKEIEIFKDFKDLILFGGEDYELVFSISEDDYSKLDKNKFFAIGKFIKIETLPSVLIYEYKFNKDILSKQLFSHF